MILLIMASANAQAAISKWVDKDGRIHYSDHPPPSGVKQQTLRSDSDTAVVSGVSAPATPKTLAEREAELKKAQKAKKEAADREAQQKAAAEAKQANCETSRQNLRGLQDGMRMMEINASGERSYLSDEQRQQRLAKSQQDVNTYCKQSDSNY